jgi:hypothetical protein
MAFSVHKDYGRGKPFLASGDSCKAHMAQAVINRCAPQTKKNVRVFLSSLDTELFHDKLGISEICDELGMN